ncbi:MAG: hypothetical protein ACLSBH_06125 [Coprobacillus cateniformis]
MHHFDVPLELVEKYGGWWFLKNLLSHFKEINNCLWFDRLGKKKLNIGSLVMNKMQLCFLHLCFPTTDLASNDMKRTPIEGRLQSVHNAHVAGAFLRILCKKS